MEEVKEKPQALEQSQKASTVPSSKADAPKDKQGGDVNQIADEMADFADMLGGFDSDDDVKKPPAAKKPEPAKKAEAPKEQKKMDESEFEKIDVSQIKQETPT